MRVSAGSSSAVPAERCVTTADERAVVLRTGDRLAAYVNRCPHDDQPLTDAWVRDGVLVCPHHFWRFDAATGHVVGHHDGLEPLPCEVTDGEVFVELPPRAPERPIREQLLDHARTWRRDDDQH